jgi:hypothetical protein
MARERISFLASDDAKLKDNVDLWFGDGAGADDGTQGDVKIRWDGTDLDMLPTANNTVFKLGDGTTSFDLWLYGASAAAYILWDASANDLIFQDSVSLKLGTGEDVEIRWDATDLDILAAADDSVIKIGNGTNSFDVWLYGNTADAYIVWDASADDLIFQDSVSLKLGTGLDAELRWDGTDLDLLAVADDQVFKLGNGTNSWDVWVYGNTAADYLLWDASASELVFAASAYLSGQKRRTAAKTGDYTIQATDSGKVLTNRGAGGAVIFTLPTVAAAFDGCDVTIYGVAAQNITVTGETAGQLVVFGDAGANSAALSTGGEIIGGGFRCICDGTSWLVLPINWADVGGAAQTATIAT